MKLQRSQKSRNPRPPRPRKRWSQHRHLKRRWPRRRTRNWWKRSKRQKRRSKDRFENLRCFGNMFDIVWLYRFEASSSFCWETWARNGTKGDEALHKVWVEHRHPAFHFERILKGFLAQICRCGLCWALPEKKVTRENTWHSCFSRDVGPMAKPSHMDDKPGAHLARFPLTKERAWWSWRRCTGHAEASCNVFLCWWLEKIGKGSALALAFRGGKGVVLQGCRFSGFVVVGWGRSAWTW